MANTAGKSDPSSVYIKATQYFVNQKLEDLKNKTFDFKEISQGDKLTSGSLSWNELRSDFQEDVITSSRVAIIGAGVAGLRTAMLLDKLQIPYKIFEANDGPGGRLFTYHFPSDDKSPAGKHDYYEVGGMRFPDNAANKPTFDLFKELGFHFRNDQNPNGELIPFVYGLDDNIRYFNNITSTARQVADGFNLFQEATPIGNVPQDFTDMIDTDEQGNVYRGVDACFYKAFNGLRAKLLANFDEEWPKLLKEWDWASTRSYLAQGPELKFPTTVIDWIEKHKSGTGRYSRAVVEEVLESITFDHPRSEHFDWWCIEGGSEGLIKKMLSTLSTQPTYNSRVTAISEQTTLDPCKRMRVSIHGQGDEYFSHVVSTVTFSVLRTIDTDGVQMNFGQREALRALNYGQSIKIAMKFKNRWWENKNVVKSSQAGGASRTDRQSRVVVYPSYGLNEDGPGVLMVSYNWDQDAARFGSLIKNTESRTEHPTPGRTPTKFEQVLLDQIYEDLTILHAPDKQKRAEFKKKLIDDTLDFHAFDWYHNPYTMGAFAQFTPGQFSTLYADILQPAGRHGNFHFAGELASHHHAWVAGAIDSANRAVGHIEQDHFTKAKWYKAGSKVPRSLVFDSDDSMVLYHLLGKVTEQAS
ncbi:Putative bifunctional amine oxidase [Psilocybe cubensis]|uniref:Bifunctional amine oxidase n=2 Tax=Psilocybe cubensis TaxID=181762 RepID=A0ACB8H7K7_PSICU|nr:Putative bifunctional amine oxidase [Psilocybe cubensis]KAH9483491.1 Putative bifunctional amine oxidase [Psilocybe cubensis]